MSKLLEIKVPDIGDFSEVEVIELLVAVGDRVEAEQSLVTVESDKASMEIPSSDSGIVKSLKVKIGDKVKEGSVILELEAADDAAVQAAPAAAPGPSVAVSQDPVQTTATVPSAPAMEGSMVNVVVPDIGDFSEVEVIEVLVSVGDKVEVESSLITVESDKASMEIPSSHAGTVTSVAVKVGDKVAKGSLILSLGTSGTQAAAAPVPAQPVQVTQAVETMTKLPSSDRIDETAAVPSEFRVSPTASFAPTAMPSRNLPHASPSVRKFARELGVDLAQVKGTGEKSRITQDDVRKYVKATLTAAMSTHSTTTSSSVGGGLSVLDWPKIDFAKFGPVESKPLSRIKKISGANLHRNWVMIPHVTNNEEADITELEALRVKLNKENEKAGIKFTMLAFIIKAVVASLKKFPEFNASLDGDQLVMKKYYHIGFAADTPNGLVVPVLKDADKKSISEIARETAELAKLARDGKLSPSQMQGGCFTISSLGGIGGTSFTPIINAPEVAILGVCRSSYKPVWNGQAFEPRLTIPLSLSYDHRVIDGALAARFNAYLASLLADFRRVLI
ncbi:acetyltransferase component of pyruvate dehydrogenase complex [Advenella faeciporci]|uniref:Acetyltransferase component of pyruvate dehydrogenase complex n=1 Tax=Advenella faeciporci TaxID=797535 RepID=A0A918JFH1_9BURK|nr:dihydrolipoyllysine-residue acetyltransferase [Advenella faeciporci]GGW78318.1 acetyltransferase component of pyruvate dehydrogenase complex [Advenella faeciporci]